MSWTVWITTILQLILLVLKSRAESNADKKKKLEESYAQVMQGIKDRDPSAITAGFSHANRV